MDELQAMLESKIKQLAQVIERVDLDLEKAPEGTLVIKRRKNQVQYYHRTKPEDTHGTYIRKSQNEVVNELAQKSYAKKISCKARREQLQLEECLQHYHPNIITEVYESLTEPERKLVAPYILPDGQYIESWREFKMKSKAEYGKDDLLLQSEDEAIITENGERVRSKSEKILADKLFTSNIPYIYECPLLFAGYGYIRPDFIVLNTRTRKEFVWEHLGLMDDSKYCENAIKKIESYEKNGYYPGRKLILTYETKNHPINSKLIEGLIIEYLL